MLKKQKMYARTVAGGRAWSLPILLGNENHNEIPCQVIRCWKWDVSEIVFTRLRKNEKYAVLILNRPITLNLEFFKEFWNNASVRMTIDGGTVQWDQYIEKLSEEERKNIKLPDLITGDFDSITEDILQKYKNNGCKTVCTPDQNLTDFTKALTELRKYTDENSLELENIFAVGQTSGRIDQILGNIQTMFLAVKLSILTFNTHLFLMSDDAVSWLLGPGDHIVIIPEDIRTSNTAWCSLIPVGESCANITTDGLKWNLRNQTLKFGELISTSNAFDGSEKVKIKCSHPVLWSMSIPRVVDQ